MLFVHDINESQSTLQTRLKVARKTFKDHKSLEFIGKLDNLSLKKSNILRYDKTDAPKRILGDYIGDRIIGIRHIVPFNVFYDSRV